MNEFGRITQLASTRPHEPLALATLVRTRGSSYRRAGARMLICADETTAGTLSAGCIEDEVCLFAAGVLRTGESKLVSFDTRRRFGCNGSIEIFIESVDSAMLREVAESLEARRPCFLQTIFEGDRAELGTRSIAAREDFVEGALVQTVEPPIRLLVVGDGPDGNALRAQALLLGWENEVMANISAWRGSTDEWTAAVIATHNFGRDSAALRHLLPVGLRYVGLVGPRRRREELLNDVIDSGATLVSDLFAPAGLHLGAETPGEIALSIVAEIKAVFSSATGKPLRERKAPIHAAETCPELVR